MKRNLQIAYLFAEWASAHMRVGAKPSWSEFWRLIRCYSEDHRHYHTIQHIYECLRYIRKHYQDHSMIHLVRFAIFYHDIVYDVTSKDNERLSADQWMQYASQLENMTSIHINLVEQLILMTASHKLEPGSGMLFRVMNDVDMHIFLCPDGHYLEYARNVWREYSVFGPEKFIEGRTAFLESLDPDQLFYTKEARPYLQHARANIALELEVLQSCPEQIVVSLF